MRELGAELDSFWPDPLRVALISVAYALLALGVFIGRQLLLGRGLPRTSDHFALAMSALFLGILVSAIVSRQWVRVFETGLAYQSAAWRHHKFSWAAVRDAWVVSFLGHRYLLVQTDAQWLWVPLYTRRLAALFSAVRASAGDESPATRALGPLAA